MSAVSLLLGCFGPVDLLYLELLRAEDRSTDEHKASCVWPHRPPSLQPKGLPELSPPAQTRLPSHHNITRTQGLRNHVLDRVQDKSVCIIGEANGGQDCSKPDSQSKSKRPAMRTTRSMMQTKTTVSKLNLWYKRSGTTFGT